MPRKIDHVKLQELMERGLNQIEIAKELGVVKSSVCKAIKRLNLAVAKVAYSENADVDGLHNELEIVKRELKNSANLIDKRHKKLVRQRIAYIILTLVLWVAIHFYYGRGFIRK